MARKAKKDAIKAATGGGIDADQLHNLEAKYSTLKSDMDGARGELGTLVKDAEERHGINRAAFKLAVKLINMPEEKRLDFLTALDQYRHVFGLDDRNQSSLALDNFQEDTEQQHGHA